MNMYEVTDILKSSYEKTKDIGLMLIKIYIPIAILILALKQFGIIDSISPYFAPFMGFLGLPGESAITILVAYSNGLYAAIATLTAFNLTPREITIIAVITGISHNLFMETAILKKLKIARKRIAFFRIGVGFLTGFLMNVFLPKGINGWALESGSIATVEFSWFEAIKSILFTSIKIIFILFLVMLFYEIFRKWSRISLLKRKLKFIPDAIGFSDNAIGPWVVGLFMGIVYGAGILYQFEKEGKINHKDGSLIVIFLILAHAIIEDTTIFYVVGGNFFLIFATRLSMALLIVKILSINDFYKKFLWIGLSKR